MADQFTPIVGNAQSLILQQAFKKATEYVGDQLIDSLDFTGVQAGISGFIQDPVGAVQTKIPQVQQAIVTGNPLAAVPKLQRNLNLFFGIGWPVPDPPPGPPALAAIVPPVWNKDP